MPCGSSDSRRRAELSLGFTSYSYLQALQRRDRRRIVYIFPALPDDEIPVDFMEAFQKALHRQPLGHSPAGMRAQRTSPAVKYMRRGHVPFVSAFQEPEPGLFERFHIRADDDHVIPSGFSSSTNSAWDFRMVPAHLGQPWPHRLPPTGAHSQPHTSHLTATREEAVFVCSDDRDFEIPRLQGTHEFRVALFLHHAIGLCGKTEEPA